MVALCHPILTLRGSRLAFSCIVVILCCLLSPCYAQVGLRTLPLRAADRNKTSLGLFAKWTGGPSSPSKRSNSTSIENELAAIFRGVAYGVTTEPTTSTTTTTTTSTPQVTKPIFKYSSDHVPPSSVPVSPPWNEDTEDARPVQHQHVEPPFSDVGYDDQGDPLLPPIEDESEVMRSDVGISKVSWIALLGNSWDIHVYTVAGLFTLLALCSLYCLARLHVTSQLLPRGYYITIHLLVFLASFFRCVIFFHDPYAVEERLPPGLSNVLFNTGIPCIITALAVLILALLKAARLRILPLNLQSPLAVAVISAILIVGSVVVDILGNFINDKQVASGLSAGMQALTAGWGAALCLGYIVIFYRIEKTSRRLQDEASRLSFSRGHMEGSLPRRFAKAALSYGARATLIASISGLLLAVLQVYGLMNTEGFLTIPPQQPWVWFAFHTTCRSLEIIMWACICFSSALPASLSLSSRKQTGSEDGQLLTVFACKSCTSCSNLSTCCSTAEKKASDDLYSTICQSSHVVRKFSFHDGRKPILQDTIATARPSPSQISTTIVPSKSKVMAGNCATLHANSDIQPLWNSYNLSSGSTSRPSSLILGENGAIRFRTVDPRHDSVQIMDFKNKKPEAKPNQDKMNIFSGELPEDNYINGSCHTPSDTCGVRSFSHERYPPLNNQDSPELYAEVVQHQYSNNEIPFSNKTNERYPLARPVSSRANNSAHVYEGYEVPNYYQCSNVGSDSIPHIYASLQPIERNDLNIRRGISHGEFYNNSQVCSPSASPWRQPISYSDAQNNAHQEYKDTKQRGHQQCCSESELCSSDYVYGQHEDISSSRSVNFNPYPPTNDLNSPQSVQSFQFPSMRDGRVHAYVTSSQEHPDMPVDLLNGTPPPHQAKGLLSKIVPSNFNNGGYSPLSCEENSSFAAVHSQNRAPAAPRPKKDRHRLSPNQPQNDAPIAAPPKARRTGSTMDCDTRSSCNKKSRNYSCQNPTDEGSHVISNPFLLDSDLNSHTSRLESESVSPLPSSVIDSDLDVPSGPESEDDSSTQNREVTWSSNRVDY